jgi:hypothetical protein
MSTTLTDRYVDATLRRLPRRQRPDVERELRASIADAVDDRVQASGDAGDVEAAVLTELGDPARLAAAYADRPLQLIGPALYLDYTRLLTTLLATVVPAVAATVAILGIFAGGTASAVIGDTLSATFMTGIQVAFWTTVVFVVIERSPGRGAAPAQPWTPAALPEPPSRRARFAELIAETVALVFVTALVLLSPVISTVETAGGDPIGVLAPWLWDTGVVYLLITFAIANVGLSFAKYYLSWSIPLAVASSLVRIGAASMFVWLTASDRLINPAFADAASWPPGVYQWTEIGIIVGSVSIIVYTVIEGVAGYSARSWVKPNVQTFIRTTADALTRTARR